MAARTSGKRSKAANKKASTTRKANSKKAKKATKAKASAKAKGAAKKATPPKKKATTKKAAPRKATTAKAASKARSKSGPAGTGELVRTRILGVAQRLLGPSTTAGGVSASGGISHTNPARSAMLRRLLG